MQIGMNQTETKKMNLTLILNLIYQEPGITRSSLSKKTKLTVAAISKLVDELLEDRLIKELEPQTQKRGRPAVGLQFRYKDFEVLAIKLSRRYIRWGVFDFNGRSKSLIEIPLNEVDTPEDLFHQFDEGINSHLEKFPNICSICFAVPGPFDIQNKQIAVITEMDKLGGLDLQPILNKDYGVPVFFAHDANAGAMSEWLTNDPKGRGEVLAYYLIGEGVGVGVVQNGKIIEGQTGMAGELGHVSIDPKGGRCRCGNRGCLEMYCSTIAIERRAHIERRRFPNSKLNAFEKVRLQDISHAAMDGDELANQLLLDAVEVVSYGAVNIINSYDPSTIIIGDQFSKVIDPYMDILKKTVSERTSYKTKPVNIEIEDQSYDHILHGAASVAIQESLNNPELLIVS